MHGSHRPAQEGLEEEGVAEEDGVMDRKKTKKLLFREWKGLENVPGMFESLASLDHEKARLVFSLMRSCGFVIVSCPWCFFLEPRGRRATCPVCDSVAHSDGRREAPVLVVDGRPALPGKTSRELGEKMRATAIAKIEKQVASDMLEDAWGRAVRPGRKVVN